MNMNGLIMTNGEPVHIRELLGLLNSFKTEILAEVQSVNENLENRVNQVSTEMDKRFDVHEVKHEREKDYRSQLIRWAVTTIVVILLGVSAMGIQVLIAKNIL